MVVGWPRARDRHFISDHIKRSAAQANRPRISTPCPRQTSPDPPRQVGRTFITVLHGMSRSLQLQPRSLYDSHSGSPKGTKVGGRGRKGEREATRYKFPDIRPFVSFEMGQFSRDLMVIAFLGGHIAFHPVQCVRPIYQSSSLSRALSDKGGCQGGVDVATRRREGERIYVYVWVTLQRGR